MHPFFPRIGKSTLIEAALGIVLLHAPIHSEDLPSEEALSFAHSPFFKDEKKIEQLDKNKDTFTINFNNVSIIEYIRFASKITNLNFIFNDEDLQFNVTIVSEEPVTPRNIISILIQVLRINGLIVLEQDNNLLITKVRTVSQLATIVSSDAPEAQTLSPIVTRVFRIKNASLGTVAAVIKPMLSDTALMELSAETQQLIITDITTNVDKIFTLLASIDAPHTSLEVDSYVAKNVDLAALIKLTTQIVAPFAEGHSLTFVPQTDTNTIFIISTPYLIERAMTILEDLDAPISPSRAEAGARGQTVFLYRLQHKAGEDFLNALKNLSSELQARGASYKLMDCLNEAKWVKESNSILFLSDDETLAKVKELLPILDTTSTGMTPLVKSNFYIYNIQNVTVDQMEHSLDVMAEDLQKAPQPDLALIEVLTSFKAIPDTHAIIFTGNTAALSKLAEILPSLDAGYSPSQLARSQFLAYHPKHLGGEELEKAMRDVADNLQQAGLADPGFLQSVNTVKWTPSTNTLVFTGTPETLSRIQALLQTVDIISSQAQAAQQEAPSQFLIYNPKHRKGEELEKSLRDIALNLKESGLADPLFLQAVKTVKWTPSTNSLLFTGTPEALSRIQALLQSLDGVTSGAAGGEGAHTFYLYKLQSASGKTVLDSLKNVSTNLRESNVPNESLISTLDDIKWIKDNNSLLLTGSKASIEQARTLIEQFDIPAPTSAPSPGANKSSFYIYKPIHQPHDYIETSLQDLGKDLEGSGLVDPDLLLTIQTMRYVPATDSLLFTGTPDSLEKIKDLLTRIDALTSAEAHVQQVGQSTFLIYKIQYVPAGQLIASLKGVTGDLQRQGTVDQGVVDSINNLKWIKDTNSILFTGTEQTLLKVESILKKFDTANPSTETGPAAPTSFIVYTPKYQPGDELIKILQDFEQNLVASGVVNKSLFDTISNVKWVPRTCSLIISGDQESMMKVEELLRRFDVPQATTTVAPTSIESIQNTSFLIYKLQYHQGDEILTALKQIATDLGPGSATSNQNLLSAVNSLQWIRVTNSLLASGEAETLAKLRDLIQNLDIPLKQVFIEILVIETSLTNTQNFGLQWGGKMQFLNKFAAGTGNFPVPAANSASAGNPVNAAGSPSIQNGINATNATTAPNATNGIPFLSGFDLGVIGDIIMHKGASYLSLGTLVNALQTDTDSTVVMNPKVITQDNRTTTVFFGSNIPFIGSLVTTSAQIVSSSSNIEYRDIGFNLTLTPTIGNDGTITLDISNDISEVVGNNTIGTSNQSNQSSTITGIQTSHTSMTTRVHVPDNYFVVLTGMIQDTKTRFKSGIPCLGGLPVIGVLFSENDRINSKLNIIIFLRPHIVNTYDDYRALTEQQENLYKEQAVMPVLKEEFDAGIDILKRPED